MNIKEWEQLELNRTSNIFPQRVIKDENIKKEKLSIVYMMVWTKVCGGSKIILEYANRLAKKGHKISIVTYDDEPTWFPISDEINFIQVPEGEEIKKYIPQCDLLVATSWKCIYEAVESNKAPVAFFEQGGSHLFEAEKLDERKRQVVEDRLKLVPFLYTVSQYSSDKIKQLYGRDSEIIYNALDNNIFYPREEKIKQSEMTSITIIGSEEFKFKNIEAILQVIRKLKERYPIQLNWVTQTKPERNKEEAIINPEQKRIGDILRNTDIYICNSEYESFGLPTLEAMTCGATVITTDTGGMRDFVQDGKNALVIQKNDNKDMEEKIELLIKDNKLRQKLAEEGIKTAQRFQWENSIEKIEEYYRKIANYQIFNDKDEKEDNNDER